MKRIFFLVMIAIFFSISSNCFCQKLGITPSINYFISEAGISSEPNRDFIKRTAEFYGSTLFFNTAEYYWGNNNSALESKIRLSLIYYLDELFKDYPNLKVFYQDEIFQNLEVTFISILESISFQNDKKFRMIFLLPIETTDEDLLFASFKALKYRLDKLQRPTYNHNGKDYKLLRLSQRSIPTLALTSVSKYEEELNKSFIEKLNTLDELLKPPQTFEIDYSTSNMKISRASLFNIYFERAFKIKFSTN